MVIPATFQDGVFRPLEPCDVAEGQRVDLLIVRANENAAEGQWFEPPDYQQAKRQALANLENGFNLGDRPLSRDEAHRR